MNDAEGEELIDLLSETQDRIRVFLEGKDLEKRIHGEAGWRIRDILGHLAAWDRQAAQSIQAFCRGEEYAIPDFDEDLFNKRAVERRSSFSAAEVIEDWLAARELFMDAVRKVPADLYQGDFLYPWGDEHGTVAKLVKDMADHDLEHFFEMRDALTG